jgi:hypothetical protein
MQGLIFTHPNLSAHVERIRGLILRPGESAATLYGSRDKALLIIHDTAATRKAMLAEGWDTEDFGQ